MSISSSNQTSIDDAAKRLPAGGAQVMGAVVDVRNAAQIASWAQQTIDRFGGVDLLFANAGGPPAGSTLSFDDARMMVVKVQYTPDEAPLLRRPKRRDEGSWPTATSRS